MGPRVSKAASSRERTIRLSGKVQRVEQGKDARVRRGVRRVPAVAREGFGRRHARSRTHARTPGRSARARPAGHSFPFAGDVPKGHSPHALHPLGPPGEGGAQPSARASERGAAEGFLSQEPGREPGCPVPGSAAGRWALSGDARWALWPHSWPADPPTKVRSAPPAGPLHPTPAGSPARKGKVFRALRLASEVLARRSFWGWGRGALGPLTGRPGIGVSRARVRGGEGGSERVSERPECWGSLHRRASSRPIPAQPLLTPPHPEGRQQVTPGPLIARGRSGALSRARPAPLREFARRGGAEPQAEPRGARTA